ncbi:MAG: RrF2 family transcriptional regulator, partial [Alkalispirochaeta sp.]
MWSHKIRYATRALIALAERGNRRTAVRELADLHDVPKKYLEAILGELKSAGLVTSTKGQHGGYILALPPEQISLAMVISVVDRDLYEALSGTAIHGKDSRSDDASRSGPGAGRDLLHTETPEDPVIDRVL